MNINKLIKETNKCVAITNSLDTSYLENSYIENYIFRKSITKNGKVIYPKKPNGVFKIPLSELTKKKKGGNNE